MQTIGDRIRALRGVAGIGCRALDRLAGLGEGHTSLIETGVRGDNLETRTATRIADAFGVSLDWLVRGQGPEPKARAVRARVAAAYDLRRTGTDG